MDKFTTLTAVACPLTLANVDTDQLIPSRFMTRPRATGYGRYLLHDLRFAADGRPTSNLDLNQPRFADTRILVAPGSFGTGSSREAAVYALWDYGIRGVIAPSFGDIFAANATKNGLLTAVVTNADAAALLAHVAGAEQPVVTVDLAALTIDAGALHLNFSIDPTRQTQLLNGWDDIDLTGHHRREIDAFREQLQRTQPWAVVPVSPR